MLVAEVSQGKSNKRELLKSTTIKCNSCNKVLGELIETTPELDIEYKHEYVCPCGGETFVIKTENTTFFHSAEEFVVSNIINISNNKFRSILEYR